MREKKFMCSPHAQSLAGPTQEKNKCTYKAG